MPSIAVSVVIATRDRPALLQAALGAVRRSLRPGDEVIVVDSASRPPAAAAVARVAAAAGARLVRCDRPGTSRARNAGARAASADIVAFTDDDCLPEPDWLQAVAAVFERHPGLGFVTGAVVPGHPNSAAPTGVALSTMTDGASRAFGPEEDPDVLGHGANMAWDRSALVRMGGFDEAFGPGAPLRAAEDHEAFWRALRTGLAGRHEPNASVVHSQWRGTWGQMRSYYGYGVGSAGLFVKRGRMEAGVPTVGNYLWTRGVTPVGRTLSRGYERGAAAEAAKLAGMVRGVLRGRRLELAGTMFVPDGHRGGHS
jgi:glycosyltransferase involved in cell wall biosynthesis